VTDLCAGQARPDALRALIFGWLAEGAREISAALCILPRERWTSPPPERLDAWPALRHVRYLVLREQHLILPEINATLDHTPRNPSTLDAEEATWDPAQADQSAEQLLADLAGHRFELLERLESAPDEVWNTAIQHDHTVGAPPSIIELALRMRQHELEHLASIWRIALYWDRVSPSTERHAPVGAVGLPFHPADRLEESH
jgi:hypothetical protein